MLTIGVVHKRYGVESYLEGCIVLLVESIPDARIELFEILLVASCSVELKVGAEVCFVEQFGGFGHQSLRLDKGAFCQGIVIALEDTAGSSKHRGSTEVKAWVACRERPHIVGRATTLAVH